MRHAWAAAVLLASLAGCGGPSVSSLHDAHRGQTPAQIRAALGEPVNRDSPPSADGAPPCERWIYGKAKALGVADDGGYIAVEFLGGKEDQMYELDAKQYQQAFGDVSTDEAVKALQDRTRK